MGLINQITDFAKQLKGVANESTQEGVEQVAKEGASKAKEFVDQNKDAVKDFIDQGQEAVKEVAQEGAQKAKDFLQNTIDILPIAKARGF
ncbi:hypothetical protein [Helicobacter suis]|uniref:hypothetical protein n=1 Tax=Helicobacter suis TaxID=104628 RepID=UPI0013D398C7|nr:hypothetical protein [Helicobacter suis]